MDPETASIDLKLTPEEYNLIMANRKIIAEEEKARKKLEDEAAKITLDHINTTLQGLAAAQNLIDVELHEHANGLNNEHRHIYVGGAAKIHNNELGNQVKAVCEALQIGLVALAEITGKLSEEILWLTVLMTNCLSDHNGGESGGSS